MTVMSFTGVDRAGPTSSGLIGATATALSSDLPPKNRTKSNMLSVAKAETRLNAASPT